MPPAAASHYCLPPLPPAIASRRCLPLPPPATASRHGLPPLPPAPADYPTGIDFFSSGLSEEFGSQSKCAREEIPIAIGRTPIRLGRITPQALIYLVQVSVRSLDPNQNVRERRLELLQVLPHRLLRPARLPIPPLARIIHVPKARFELARVFPPPPQDGASTNFATWAGVN